MHDEDAAKKFGLDAAGMCVVGLAPNLVLPGLTFLLKYPVSCTRGPGRGLFSLPKCTNFFGVPVSASAPDEAVYWVIIIAVVTVLATIGTALFRLARRRGFVAS